MRGDTVSTLTRLLTAQITTYLGRYACRKAEVMQLLNRDHHSQPKIREKVPLYGLVGVEILSVHGSKQARFLLNNTTLGPTRKYDLSLHSFPAVDQVDVPNRRGRKMRVYRARRYPGQVRAWIHYFTHHHPSPHFLR